MAQTQKTFEVEIVNGDTTINGKDIKKLNAQERKDALTQLNGIDNDTSNKVVKLRKLKKLNSQDSTFAFSFKLDDEMPLRLNRDFAASISPFRLNNRNTQDFDYTNTDNDGVSTNMHFTVTDVTLNDRKKPLGELDESYLSVRDLNISPEFSTGKINLSFNLPKKFVAEVSLWDYDVVLWTEKVSDGSFNKRVSWPKEGEYSLTTKQGTKSVSKQILKQN
jgi:hypothetical protein